MSILLPIETQFVNSFTYEGGSLQQLHTLQTAEGNLKKKQFEKSLAQAPQVRAALVHFASKDGQRQLADSGLSWNKGEFVEKALRYSDRSQANLLVRIADRNDAHPELITKYKREQTRLSTAGQKAPRSIQHFDKWSRALLDQANETGETIEDVVEGAEVEATAEPSNSTNMAQFRFKHPIHGNIVVNIDENGAITTTNTVEHIGEALATFRAMIQTPLEVAA